MLQKASALYAGGDLEGAERECRRALATGARDPATLHLLAAIRFARGARPEAHALAAEAVALAPGDAALLNTQGALLLEDGRAEEAAAALARALELRPAYFEARYNLGNAARAQGDLAGALAAYRAAMALEPRALPVLNNLAMVLLQLGQVEEARPLLEQAVALGPDQPDALVNMAHVLLAEGEAAKALPLAARAAALAPGASAAQAVLADALESEGRGVESLAPRRRAATLAPADRGRLLALARAEREHGRVAVAIELLEGAIARAPGDVALALELSAAAERAGDAERAHAALAAHGDTREAGAEVLSRLAWLSLAIADWTHLDRRIARLRERLAAHPGESFWPGISLVLPGVGAAEQRAWAEQWVRNHLGRIAPVVRPPKAPGGRLVLGYLSSDFHAHATTHLIAEMIEHHDRARVEAVGLSFSRDDGTPERRRIVAAFERFVELGALGDRSAARAIAALGVDVLVDLKGYTEGARPGILACRPAPVQVNFLGYPGTMGAACIDCLVADGVTCPPGSDAFYTERVLRMPHTYQPNPRARMAAPSGTRDQHGLAERALVLACFNPLFKLTPQVFGAWCELLGRLPDAVLWLLDCAPAAKARLAAFAAAQAIDPSRIVFAPRLPVEQHLARLAHADIALDMLPYNAHTTASDALRAGVPFASLTGETFASRVGASVLGAAGLGEWSAGSFAEHLAQVGRLAGDARLRAQIRRHLVEDGDRLPLFDPARFARDFEDLLPGVPRPS
jgi:predicted O-linked N-acetylglucosamine transferase (SPINDLY family)